MPRNLLYPILLTLLLPVAPAARAGVPYTDANPVFSDPLTRELVEQFEAASLGRRARFAAYVLREDTGEEFVQINADAQLQPASLLKLVTSAAVLDVLGPERTFETRLELHGEKGPNREFEGNVVIRGGGDPSLGARFQENRNDVTRLLREWARLIRQEGIREIRGHVYGDGSRYTGDRIGIGWDPSELGQWYSAEVSALNFNENTVDVVWRSGSRRGALAQYELIPDTTYVTFGSSVRVGPPSLRTTAIRYFRFADSNEIRARGQVVPESVKYDFAAIHDPARYTAWLLREQLVAHNVEVKGIAMTEEGMREDDLTTQPLVVSTVSSPPVSELLGVVNGDSQNLYAEVLMRELALASGHPGSFRGGTAAVDGWLRANRLQRSGTVIVDGSGLSPANRLSVRLIGRVVRHALNAPNGDVYRSSLATPGNGSLANRMNTVSYRGLEGKLWAKTGYLTGVMALAGAMETESGGRYIFVFLVNQYDRGQGVAARDLLDSMVLTVCHSDVLP